MFGLLKKCLFISVVVTLFVAAVFVFRSDTEAEVTSLPNTSTWVTNNTVRAIVTDGTTVYVGGDFTEVGFQSGHGVPVDSTTGERADVFPQVNTTVNAVIPDGSGGWYIGGSFTKVGTETRNRMAHILSDGTVDPAFAPDLNDEVVAMALSSDETTLYIGGQFTDIGGTTRNYIAALNTSDGTVIAAFDPDADNRVSTLALSSDEGTLYIGGEFTTIGGETRNYIAALDTSDGSVTTFDPDADSGVYVLTLSSDDATLYAGGGFTTIGTAARSYIAALDTSDGSAITAFDANADNPVNALALSSDDETLYAGGSFGNIGCCPNESRSYIAALNTSDGSAITAFDAGADNEVFSLILSSDEGTLYTGGVFNNIGGAAHNYVAALNTATGNAISGFDPKINNAVWAFGFTSDEATLYIGGDFSTIDVTTRNRIAAFSVSDGSVTAFDPDADGAVLSLALSPDSATLYAGGDFLNIGGAARTYIAALDTSDGSAVTAFNAGADNGMKVLLLSSDGSTLYAGGTFNLIGGTSRNRIAALDISNGNAISTFNPGADDFVYTLALSSDDGTLYAGGDFTTIGGVSRNRIAALNTSDGSAISTFDPNSNLSVFSLTLSSDDATLYAGGGFTTIGGASRNRIAALNTSDGTAVSTYDPNATGGGVLALTLSSDDTTLYAGGFFTNIAGVARSRIAALNTDEDSAKPFDPVANDVVRALALTPDDEVLYIGGAFTTVGGEDRPYLASFGEPTPIPTPTPTPTPDSDESSGSSGGFAPGFGPISPTPIPTGHGDPANLARYGLKEGDTISADGSPNEPNFDPDVYIVNEHGYKRLFLNPIIFSFYGHLGFRFVKSIVPVGRDAFPTSGLFRNCEANDPKVYAVEVTGEDSGILHHVNISGDAAVSQDSDFFKKVFCINNNEFNWYLKSPTPYTSLSQMPVYRRPGQ